MRDRFVLGLAALLALPACSHPAAVATSSQPTPSVHNLPPSQADYDFMTGMIHHHAQALEMAHMVPTHEASPALVRLAERIDVGQKDEIAIMSRWLREHDKPVPEIDTLAHHNMPGMDHTMHMPGMLTPEQMTQLDQARGPAFDRLFLTFMIQHHQGAITMVDQLFGSQASGQNETVFRMASDVYADQTTEIERMQRMLAALPSGENRP